MKILSSWAPVAAGVAMTAYEAGMVRAILTFARLVVGAAVGLGLAASTWLFDFSEVEYLPHLIHGLAEFGAALITETKPRYQMARTTA